MYSLKPFLALFASFVIVCSCGSKKKDCPDCIDKPQEGAVAGKTDTLSNEPQCHILVDDKKFDVPADSIETGWSFSDSSMTVTIHGVGGGYLHIVIPNLFKCPCDVPTGYSSINTKISGSDDYAVLPTVSLYNYPVAGPSFNNLNDGYHEAAVKPGAITIQHFEQMKDSSSASATIFFIKAKIKTTVLKNVYESGAGKNNRDYPVEGSLVIKSKEYL